MGIRMKIRLIAVSSSSGIAHKFAETALFPPTANSLLFFPTYFSTKTRTMRKRTQTLTLRRTTSAPAPVSVQVRRNPAAPGSHRRRAGSLVHTKITVDQEAKILSKRTRKFHQPTKKINVYQPTATWHPKHGTVARHCRWQRRKTPAKMPKLPGSSRN